MNILKYLAALLTVRVKGVLQSGLERSRSRVLPSATVQQAANTVISTFDGNRNIPGSIRKAAKQHVNKVSGEVTAAGGTVGNFFDALALEIDSL